jgi:hypothetical protein
MLIPTKIPKIAISLEELEMTHKWAELRCRCDEMGYSCNGLCDTPEGLFKEMLIMQVLTGAQSKPMLREAWKGPGYYTVTFCIGASQEQDVFKQDDTWLEVTFEPM